jgi:murein DD-endopeptidase MepM/ murein hydrolase activator NlpD
MDLIRESLSNPDSVEKVSNYLSGLGFQNSKQAFYNEVDHLNTYYGESLDFPYIMSALYYVDIFHSDSEYLTTDDNEKLCSAIDKEYDSSKCSAIQLGVQLAKYYLKESSTTTDNNGLVYSANKIYRLRDLAKHQFLGEKEEKTSSLYDYMAMYGNRLNDEQKRLLQYLPWLILYALAHSDPVAGPAFDKAIVNLEIGKVLPDLILAIQGTESWGSIARYFDTGKYDAGVINAIKDFVTTYLNFFMDVKYVTFGNNASEYSDDADDKTILSSIYITYYDFSFDQDKFENYLIDHYIKEMPEFSSLIRNEEGKVDEDKVTRIVYEIKTTKEIFDGIYENDKTAEENNKCIGNINLDLLSELHTPIDLTIGQSIKFSNSNNYGLYKGELHKGVDLEEDSTGTKTGDKVYSLYNGKVVESTFDDTYSDKDAKGGWLVIEYNVQYEDSTMGNSKLSAKFKSQASKIKVYYGGLDPGSIKLKQNDIVEKGQVIGNVGTSFDSENGVKPSLHFAIYDLKQGMFLNPINMFITCRRANATSCSSDSKEGKTVELPTNVFSIKQENYTVTLYDKRGFASYGIASGTLQYKVHRLWLNDGARYKNGIAVLNINGTDRYLVAVTSKFGNVGDLIYANLENDTTIPMVIADIKSYSDTGAVNKELCSSAVTTDPGCYGHKDGSLLSVLEFEFDTTKWRSGTKNPVSLGQEWDTSKKVKSISNCGTILN